MSTLKPNMGTLTEAAENKVANVHQLLNAEMQGCSFLGYPAFLAALKCFLDAHPEIAPLKFTPDSLGQYMQARNWIQTTREGDTYRFAVYVSTLYEISIDELALNMRRYSHLDPT